VSFAGEAESRSLFAEGRRMRESGHCADAIVVFRKAYDTFPDGLGALRNVAECEQEVGMFASARRDWSDLRLAVLKSTSPKYVGWDKDAEDGQAALAGRVARLTLKLTGAQPEGLRVQLNGQPFDPRLLEVELEEDDGALKIEVFYGARKPLVRTAELTEGQHQTIEIDVPPPPPPDKVSSGGGSPDGGSIAPTSNNGKAMRIAGGVSLAVGGLGVVGTIVTLVMRQSALSSINSACPTHTHCPSSISGDVSRGKTTSTLVNVFAVTAGVGVGLGLTLVLAAPKDPPKAAGRAPSMAVGLDPTWGGGVFSLAGDF
jgi:hypothetical protein